MLAFAVSGFGNFLSALRWRRVAPGVQRILASYVTGGDLMFSRMASCSKWTLPSHGSNELTMILEGAGDDLRGQFGPRDVADLDGATRISP
ncbi:MAG: hypothetical protein ABIU96_08805 [Rhodanobacter sp.]